MGLFSLFFSSRRKRQRELEIRRQESRRQLDARKRETLRKKVPTPVPDDPSRRASPLSEKPKDVPLTETPVKAAELDVKATVPHPTQGQKDRNMKRHRSLQAAPRLPLVFVDPPPECAELSGDSITHPPRSSELAELPHSEVPERRRGSQEAAGCRNMADEPCPPCLVPGFRWVGSEDRPPKTPLRSSTWPYEGLSKTAFTESIGPSIGFRTPDEEDRLANAKSEKAEEDAQEPVITMETPSTVATDTPPAMSPISPSSPLSSNTSLSSEDEDTIKPLISTRRRNTGSVIKPPGSQADSSPPPPVELGLYPKGSTTSLKQLRARHSLLESRRQTLLQLHRIEQEQEEILNMLASMSDAED